MNEIEKARESIPVIKSLIEKNTNDRVVNIYGINNDRHFILETDKRMKYQLIFKRDFFRSFGKIFGTTGLGESINEEMVEWALRNYIHNFIFVYENGYAYTIPVNEFHDYAMSHGMVRKTDKTGEITLSCPLKMLKRWR